MGPNRSILLKGSHGAIKERTRSTHRREAATVAAAAGIAVATCHCGRRRQNRSSQATKQQSNKATKQQSNKATKKQSKKAKKQKGKKSKNAKKQKSKQTKKQKKQHSKKA